MGIESLTEAGSTLFNTKPLMRLWGTVPTATEPYLSMSGTSMASPVVSGTIALMLQANPALTPNLVKAILQFTAESRDGYNALTQGAGFLNTRGAVELAQSMAGGASSAKDTTPWSRPVDLGQPPDRRRPDPRRGERVADRRLLGQRPDPRRAARRMGRRLRRDRTRHLLRARSAGPPPPDR